MAEELMRRLMLPGDISSLSPVLLVNASLGRDHSGPGKRGNRKNKIIIRGVAEMMNREDNLALFLNVVVFNRSLNKISVAIKNRETKNT